MQGRAVPAPALPSRTLHSLHPWWSATQLTHLQVSSSRTMARTMVPSITSVRLQMSLNGMPRAHSYTTCSPQGNRRRQGCTAMRGVNGCQASVPAVQLANAGGQRLASHPGPLQAGGPQTVSTKLAPRLASVSPNLRVLATNSSGVMGSPHSCCTTPACRPEPTVQFVAFNRSAHLGLGCVPNACARAGRGRCSSQKTT